MPRHGATKLALLWTAQTNGLDRCCLFLTKDAVFHSLLFSCELLG
jgi:hypothetical protein